MEEVLHLFGVSKSYGELRALETTELSLPRGRIIGLLGPNGSGKTTLIKLVAGLLVPTEGQVAVAGATEREEILSRISYLPERNSLPLGMTAEGILGYFADFYKDFDLALAKETVARLGIPADRPISAMSKGNREKLQLTVVMCRRADLYLLDEPIGGVDPAAREYILDIITSCRQPSSTVLVSTHLIADVEPILDEFLFLAGGRIIRYGSAPETRAAEGKTLDAIFREVFRC